MKQYTLHATAAAGIESLVAKELQEMGYETETNNGFVRYQGNINDIARTNIWLRTADRIKIIMAEFKADTFDDLFEGVFAIPWEDIIPMDGEFPVSGKSIKSKLHSVPNVQKITKKAISKRLQNFYHRRNHLPETGNLYPIEVAIRKDIATISLDTSGSSLFKRGYREHKGVAPLKENMAAALVMLTTWHPDRPLYDPTCGSGTILIEAALIGHNIAPGLNRTFVAEKWHLLNSNHDYWSKIKKEARAEINMDIELDILGTDIDHRMIQIAQDNAKAAGVENSIHFKQMQLKDYRPNRDYGILISNPPYGDRMLTQEETQQIYTDMGLIYRDMPTWSKYILTSDETFEEHYGQKASKKRKLYNGALKVDYYQFWSEK